MDVSLFPRQQVAFGSEATEVLYGGAAGGGKSYYLRVSAIRWAFEVPGVQVYIFRRTLPDLRANHLRGPTSFHALLQEFIDSGAVRYRSQENEFVFSNGSRIALGHCQYEDDVNKYQGAEIHVLMIDELTHFTAYMYTFLRSRVRLAGLDVPEAYKGRLPRIECGSNPGSIGHAWVKRTFVSASTPEAIWQTGVEDGGMLRQYIPASLADNPALQEADPTYLNRLEGLANPALVRAMRDGDWDIIAGAAFERFRRGVHIVEPFDVPAHWMRFMAIDWGSAKPFSVGWWAVSDGGLLEDGRVFPAESLIRYREWYGWNNNPDEGVRMESTEVAYGILSREKAGERVVYRVADNSMFAKHDGPSVAERMASCGVVLMPSQKDRKQGYLEMRQRIAGMGEGPLMYSFTTNQDGFNRTIPDLVLDERDPENVDTRQEDHVFDECQYACLSRPWIKKRQEEATPKVGMTFNDVLARHDKRSGRQWWNH